MTKHVLLLLCGLAPALAAASSFDTAQIDRLVQAKSDAVSACYEEGLARKPKLSGKILVLFTVENDGTVSDAVTKKGTTLRDDAVIGCVLAEFKTLVFPSRVDSCDASKENCSVKITYPLSFTP
jgi:hypothetical protein